MQLLHLNSKFQRKWTEEFQSKSSLIESLQTSFVSVSDCDDYPPTSVVHPGTLHTWWLYKCACGEWLCVLVYTQVSQYTMIVMIVFLVHRVLMIVMIVFFSTPSVWWLCWLCCLTQHKCLMIVMIVPHKFYKYTMIVMIVYSSTTSSTWLWWLELLGGQVLYTFDDCFFQSNKFPWLWWLFFTSSEHSCWLWSCFVRKTTEFVHKIHLDQHNFQAF